MRIALVSDCYWPRVNGVTVSLQSFRDEFLRRGHDVRIYCPAYPESYGSSTEEPSVRRLPSMANGISREDRLLRPSAFPALFRDLDEFAPDVVHINTEFTMSIAARLYVRSRGLPLVMTSHTDYEDYVSNYIRILDPRPLKAFVRFVMRRVFEPADILVTPSPSMERRLRGYRVDKPIHVIPTGIPDLFAPRPAAEVAAWRARLDARFPGVAGRRLLIFAGRVTEEKDVAFLLPVLERVGSAKGDVGLLVAGDGPFKDKLVHLAARRGLAGRIAFAGYVPRAELPLAYCASEIFVFPSKTETLGLCTIEAMAVGLPVVAIGEMGTRDVMGGDHGGFMVPNEVGAFTDAVLALLGDEGLRRAKAAEALEVAERYRIGTVADRLYALYEEAARRKEQTR